MKIGILTFHYAHNCGACLQAFALKTYLEKNKNCVSIINYKNKYIVDAYPKKQKVNFLLYDLKHPHDFFKKILKNLDFFYGRKQWKTQFAKFEHFISLYLLNGQTQLISPNAASLSYFDVIIAGSDQIWNKKLTNGYDDIYFLNFQTSAKKIFYAPSYGSDTIPEKDYSYIKKSLFSDGKILSTRERSVSEEIERQFKKSVPTVVDPCFLLSKDDYTNIFNLSIKKRRGKFLFLYQINETNKSIRKYASIIAKALKLEIVEFHYYKTREYNKPYQKSDFGPIDFLKHIYNSDFVITNSFHGIVFSLIFKKQFYAYYSTDSRKDNLLKEFGLERRHIYNYGELDLNEAIDYNSLNIEKYSASSKKFIADSIGIKND